MVADPYGSVIHKKTKVLIWGGDCHFVNGAASFFNDGTDNTQSYYYCYKPLNFFKIKPYKPQDTDAKFTHVIVKQKQTIKQSVKNQDDSISYIKSQASFANTIMAQRHHLVRTVNKILSLLAKGGDFCITLPAFDNPLVLQWSFFLKKMFKSVQLHKLNLSGFNKAIKEVVLACYNFSGQVQPIPHSQMLYDTPKYIVDNYMTSMFTFFKRKVQYIQSYTGKDAKWLDAT